MKNMKNIINNNYSAGMMFTSWLTLLFVTLKLLGAIQWSWWWVLAPMWVPISAVVLIAASATLTVYLINRFGE